MKAVIKGRNYNFRVVAEGFKFYIEAIHSATLRFSFINNLNVILSEFNINIDDKKVSESQWITFNEKQGNSFFKKAIKFLSDRLHRDYIEKRLDEDRKCGEWENYRIT